MRSWVYYIELIGHYEGGRSERSSAVYVVAIPEDEPLASVDMECFASEYAPLKLAINHGKAYAIGVDEAIDNLENYSLKGYREDLELYVFTEGLSFTEGLKQVYRLLYINLKKEGLISVEPVVDVGSPPTELMMECLREVVSS
ncbi:MAG: hypothetical protein NZM36_04220 [Aquificaceae bacterium]|nr:hypothetical protein [Aquificaceae bacterium]